MRTLRPLMLLTDLGFLTYWLVTVLHLIPASYLFRDYSEPLVVAWNWSFLPLDLLISATGLGALTLERRRQPLWKGLALISLTLTSCSGLMAIAFWTIRADFSASWWISNGFLLLYPLGFIPGLLRKGT